MNPDLNCDLGEGEPWRVTQALLTQVTSANVAAGFQNKKAAKKRLFFDVITRFLWRDGGSLHDDSGLICLIRTRIRLGTRG